MRELDLPKAKTEGVMETFPFTPPVICCANATLLSEEGLPGTAPFILMDFTDTLYSVTAQSVNSLYY